MSNFTWDSENDNEFEMIKNEISHHIKLTPFDTRKGVHLHTDASFEGLGYVISQPLEDMVDNKDTYRLRRQFITCNSCGLSETQARYSVVELEALAVFYACSKSSYYLEYAPEIHLFSDSKVVVDMFNMDLAEIKNKRLQRIFEKLRPYAIVPHHVKGDTNYVTDRLSRHPQGKKDCPEFPGEEITISNKSRWVLESSIETKDPMLDAMAKNALEDPDYQYMIQCIQNRTPIDKINRDSELFKMEGSLQFLSTIQTKSGSLIFKDNSEV